jgi:hypothetical protein
VAARPLGAGEAGAGGPGPEVLRLERAGFGDDGALGGEPLEARGGHEPLRLRVSIEGDGLARRADRSPVGQAEDAGGDAARGANMRVTTWNAAARSSELRNPTSPPAVVLR